MSTRDLVTDHGAPQLDDGSSAGIPEPSTPVFIVEPHTWTRADIVDAIDAMGRLAPLRRELRAGRAALTGVVEGGDEPDPRLVRTTTEQVRRVRGLLTRDETEAWLSNYQLDLTDLVAFGERSAARRSISLDRLAELVEESEDSNVPDDHDLWAMLVFSGVYHKTADELAEQAAASAAWRAAQEAPPDEAALPTPQDVRREAAAFAQSVVTEDALRHSVDRHQLEWIVVESDRLTFGTVEAAREARLCLMEGATIDELSGHALRSESGSFLVGDIDVELQALYAGALAGEILGPFPGDRGFVVWSVTGRGEPSLKDPETRRRAQMEVTRQAVQREVNARVRWPLHS